MRRLGIVAIGLALVITASSCGGSGGGDPIIQTAGGMVPVSQEESIVALACKFMEADYTSPEHKVANLMIVDKKVCDENLDDLKGTHITALQKACWSHLHGDSKTCIQILEEDGISAPTPVPQ